MNELTKQLQEIMVPKAALIAYEYQEGHYASGSHYLELRPINKKGRMEAGIPVTYEFMDSLVESYSDGNRRIPHGWLPPNMLWCDTRRGHESYVWYNPPGKRRMFFKNDLNIGDGMFHVPGVIYIIKNENSTSALIEADGLIKVIVPSKRFVEPYKTRLLNNDIKTDEELESVFIKYNEKLKAFV